MRIQKSSENILSLLLKSFSIERKVEKSTKGVQSNLHCKDSKDSNSLGFISSDTHNLQNPPGFQTVWHVRTPNRFFLE